MLDSSFKFEQLLVSRFSVSEIVTLLMRIDVGVGISIATNLIVAFSLRRKLDVSFWRHILLNFAWRIKSVGSITRHVPDAFTIQSQAVLIISCELEGEPASTNLTHPCRVRTALNLLFLSLYPPFACLAVW